MHYTAIQGAMDLEEQMREAKEAGAENIAISEDDVLQASLPSFIETIDELRFKRIKMAVSGLMLSNYASAAELIKHGVRLFEVTFHHILPFKHDRIGGPESFRMLAKAIGEVYTASVDLDIPIIFQFVLRFDEPEYLPKAVEDLSEMYPAQFRIEGATEAAREALSIGNAKGIWVEIEP